MIDIKDMRKVYSNGKLELEAIKKVNFHIKKGEFVAIMGPSGSGKSTIMNILGCLDKPTSGEYYLDKVNVSHLDDDDLSKIRNDKIGFVFQSFNLLSKLTALENVALPLVYAGIKKKERIKRAGKALKSVGLSDRTHHLPNELSGGQRQRVAIARALVNEPSIIMADEPTGNLDSKSEEEILEIFKELNKNGTTIAMVTHEPNIANHCQRIIRFKDGELVGDERL
ncbi:MAG: ABC transporter ATP-binding protein [Psychrilyobacter sp.]|uniref:ABC transporter ATP-binding protein n=1 Tax=Psychrilyobacter sp. TaxID=2586924 RepID=UPI003C7177D4